MCQVAYIGRKHRKKQSWSEIRDEDKYLYGFISYNNDNRKYWKIGKLG